jgi:ABC-type branched-subunit amino acid transport system substrate-binding protein
MQLAPRAALLAAAVLLLAAPGGAATTKGPAAGKTVSVGVIADVTGSAAVYGTMQQDAYQLAAADIAAGVIDAGGANLSFNIQDAASDGAQVVNLMQKFTTDGTTPLVLGPTLSGEAFMAFPLAKAASTASRSPSRRRSRRRSHASKPFGTPRRSPSSTATTTRSPRPTARSSRASSRRRAPPSSTPRRSTSATRTSRRS